MEIHNTSPDVKAANFNKFSQLIANQFTHGGTKYAIKGLDKMEATDLISAAFGGENSIDWILGTLVKYIFRFQNFQREKDLLKIATYVYLLWLKCGFHTLDDKSHDEDVGRK